MQCQKIFLKASVKASKYAVKKYDPDYSKFGFIIAGRDAEPKAQCAECREIVTVQYFMVIFWSWYTRQRTQQTSRKKPQK